VVGLIYRTKLIFGAAASATGIKGRPIDQKIVDKTTNEIVVCLNIFFIFFDIKLKKLKQKVLLKFLLSLPAKILRGKT